MDILRILLPYNLSGTIEITYQLNHNPICFTLSMIQAVYIGVICVLSALTIILTLADRLPERQNPINLWQFLDLWKFWFSDLPRRCLGRFVRSFLSHLAALVCKYSLLIKGTWHIFFFTLASRFFPLTPSPFFFSDHASKNLVIAIIPLCTIAQLYHSPFTAATKSPGNLSTKSPSILSTKSPSILSNDPKGLVPAAHFIIAWGWQRALKEVTTWLGLEIWSLLYLFDLKLIELLKISPATNRLHGVWRGKLYIWCLPLWNQVAPKSLFTKCHVFFYQYLDRVPERLFPGRCDLWGQSHQIFHVLVVAGALAHLKVEI